MKSAWLGRSEGLQRKRDLRKTLGRAGREYAELRFSNDAILDPWDVPFGGGITRELESETVAQRRAAADS